MNSSIYRRFVSAISETKQIEAIQTWEVRWTSMQDSGIAGRFPHLRPEIEVFTSLEAAEEFAQSLRDAFKLVRCTNCIYVTVEKRT